MRTMSALPELPSQHFEEWPLNFLADYIEQTHHLYIEREAPVLLQVSTEMMRSFGRDQVELLEIDRLVHTLMRTLQQHMLHEETVLFPYIKRLVAAQGNRKQPVIKPFETVRKPFQAMEHEHVLLLKVLDRIRDLCHNFTRMADSNEKYYLFLNKLRDFSDDLLQHTELENDILFPKAIALELEIEGDEKYQNRWFC